MAHLNGYPAYRLPCHVSLRRFLGRYNDADTRPEVVWGVVESARKRALPLGGEWVENYLSPAAADTYWVAQRLVGRDFLDNIP